MKQSKVDLLGDLLRLANNRGKGNKTIILMTALLVSWREMEIAEVVKIVHETHLACSVRDELMNLDEEMH